MYQVLCSIKEKIKGFFNKKNEIYEVCKVEPIFLKKQKSTSIRYGGVFRKGCYVDGWIKVIQSIPYENFTYDDLRLACNELHYVIADKYLHQRIKKMITDGHLMKVEIPHHMIYNQSYYAYRLTKAGKDIFFKKGKSL